MSVINMNNFFRECHEKGAIFLSNTTEWNKLFAAQPKHGPAHQIPDDVDEWHSVTLVKL